MLISVGHLHLNIQSDIVPILLLLDCDLPFREHKRVQMHKCTASVHRTQDFVDSGSRCAIHLGSAEVSRPIVPCTKFKSVQTECRYRAHGGPD